MSFVPRAIIGVSSFQKHLGITSVNKTRGTDTDRFLSFLTVYVFDICLYILYP